MESIIIREAAETDLPAMTEIYNDAVIHTTATLDLEPRSVEDRRPWFKLHNKGNHPLIVAVRQAAKSTETSEQASQGEKAGQPGLTGQVGPGQQTMGNQQAGQIVGYASLSELFDKDAYISTVELSIYVHPEHKRRGIGDRLMGEILRMARDDEATHLVVSKITAGNAASDHLHEKYGFVKVGTLHECAWKFGQLLDMDMYELFV